MRPGRSERRGQWRRPSTRRGCFCGRRSRRRPTAAPLDSYAHSVRYTYAARADANANVPPQPLSRPPPPPGSHLPHRRVSHTRHLVVVANSVHERAPAAAFMPVAATRFAPTPAAAFPPPQPPVSPLPAAARRTYATCRCSAVPRECECQCAPLLFFFAPTAAAFPTYPATGFTLTRRSTSHIRRLLGVVPSRTNANASAPRCCFLCPPPPLPPMWPP
ncbi:hypothetical protein B0H11DRAFT_2035666, partial [Mycena galericulata]